MGFITQYSNKAVPTDSRAFPGQNEGLATWRRVFQTTNKEDGGRYQGEPVGKPVAGGSYTRSPIGGDAAVKRLHQALRSMAPGGWSDDRYEQVKHFVGIAYIAIHRICTQLQRSEFQVYRKSKNHPDGKVPITDDDPAYDLVRLLEKPNNQDSFGKYMYRLGQQKYLTGTALTWMVPNMLRKPYELYCIPTPIAIPQPAINPDYPDGFYRIQPVYPYGPFSTYPTPTTAVGAPIPAQQMMRNQFPHPLLRYEGWSPLTALRMHLDSVEGIDKSRANKMRRSIRPSAVLNMDEVEGITQLPESEIERIHAEWEAFQGPDNAGRLIIGAMGGTLEEFGATPSEMDYPNSWDQLVGFCLGGFGITKPAAGMIDDASYATLFATLKQLYELTLAPDLEDFGADFTRYLAPFFGSDLIVEVRGHRIDDHDVAMAKVGVMVQGSLGTVNEARKLLDLPVTNEEWGEERLGMAQMIEQQKQMEQQQQMQQGDQGLQEEQPTDEEGNPAIDETGMLPEEEQELEDPNITENRPTPGPLGRGALGPRMKAIDEAIHVAKNLRLNGKEKRLLNKRMKSIRNRYHRKPSLNGSH